ncbi:MAG: polysaccharide pyruvyl transferase family protein, partial [Methanomassiliicoccales archaeon]|nr:polysaccharide pyruvyl transferase family protein [Methanomassiliicoccales archaeon]
MGNANNSNSDPGRSAKSSSGTPRVLLVGYNGANNTGSEARLLTIIEEFRYVLGSEVEITVPTLNEGNLRRYLKEGPKLYIAPVPSLYFFAMKRLVKENDLVVLVEGSCYMDTWAYYLLWAFLGATKYAHAMGKPSLAYAVDSGEVSDANRLRIAREASKTDLIITRTCAAAERLRTWGVTAPIEVTGDQAFVFEPHLEDEGLMRRVWPEAGSSVAGIAVVDFYIWPVVVRPWDRSRYLYKWPYYFSHSNERSLASEALAGSLAAQADRLTEQHGKHVALICMENVDEPLAREVRRRMKRPDLARVFSSREFNSSQMTSVLRNLDLLLTSRYHASVLSMAAHVPQIAVGHDLRLEDLYGEIGIKEEYFFKHNTPNLWEKVRARVDALVEDPEPVKKLLKRGNEEQVKRALRNRELLLK